MNAPDHTASRLTPADVERIDAALCDYVRNAVAGLHPARRPLAAANALLDHRHAVARICAHAIGCALHDLRESEIEAIMTAITVAAIQAETNHENSPIRSR